MQTAKEESYKLNRNVPPTENHTFIHTSTFNVTFTIMQTNKIVHILLQITVKTKSVSVIY